MPEIANSEFSDRLLGWNYPKRSATYQDFLAWSHQISKTHIPCLDQSERRSEGCDRESGLLSAVLGGGYRAPCGAEDSDQENVPPTRNLCHMGLFRTPYGWPAAGPEAGASENPGSG